MHAEKGKDNVLYLVKGKHKLEFIADGNPAQTLSKVIEIPDNNYSDFVEISFADKYQQPTATKPTPQPSKELSAEEMYLKGREYYDKKDYKQAFEWYKKAAEYGHAPAQYHLGLCFEFGAGIEQNYTKAVEWYKKAAEQGNKFAQNSLGECYYYGKGVEPNYTKAVEWYKKAAEQGVTTAASMVNIIRIR